MTSKLPNSFFQTTDIPIAKKYEAFRESIGVIFEVGQVQKAPREFDAWIRSLLISELMLVECETVGQKFSRTPQMIAQDGLDHFLVQIFYTGFTSHIEGHDENVCPHGKILILDASRPWEAMNSDFRNLTLVIPRRLLATELIEENIHHGRMIDVKTNPFAEILFKYLISLDETVENITVEEAHSLVRPSLDLVAAALNYKKDISGNRLMDTKESYNLALRFRIKSYLDKNISLPVLDAEQVSMEFDVSLSYLDNLFAKDEGIMEYLHKRRMDLAFKRILIPRSSAETISEIAHDLGYIKESVFSRHFKTQFGATPSELKYVNALTPLLEGKSRQEQGRIWEEWFRTL
jgi:AraC-like DNA-binding protein